MEHNSTFSGESTQPQGASDLAKQPSSWRKRFGFARKIGRGICILLIVAICGHTIYNVFRLLDSFQEKDVPSALEHEEQWDIPLISFDPQGQWHIQGLHFDPSQTPFQAIMPMPETANLIGTRTDKDGNPLMQLFEIVEENASQTSTETQLLQNWATQGWTTKRVDMPNLVSYRCDHREKQCFVQFFSDAAKHYVLICLSTSHFK